VAGCCELGNEPSGSIKDEEFFDRLINYQFLRECSATRRWLVSYWTVSYIRTLTKGMPTEISIPRLQAHMTWGGGAAGPFGLDPWLREGATYIIT
jgi:hypothetical protein